jgi:outer membrane protein TolC
MLRILFCVLGGLFAAPVLAQDSAFTVEQLSSLALQNSRLVRAAGLEAEKSEQEISATSALRYPQFHVTGLASKLMEPLDFTFKTGTLGNIGGVPFPATDTAVNAAGTSVNGLFIGTAIMPLSQQYKISLAVSARSLGADIARQKYRQARCDIKSSVEKLAFGILEARKALEASKIAEEGCASGVADAERYSAERVVLPSEFLKAKAALAKQQYESEKLEHTITELSEQLNRLTGRPLDAPVEIALPELAQSDPPPDLSEGAVARRADVSSARYVAEQAAYDAKIKAAEYIPDLSVSVSDIRLSNTQYLPDNIASAGLYLNWDVFDWGKRSHELNEKRQSREQAEKLLAETMDTARTDLRARYDRLDEARKLCEAAQLSAQAADETLRVARDKFDEHALLPRDYNAARAADALAQSEYIKALGEYYQARTQFAIASGEDI